MINRMLTLGLILMLTSGISGVFACTNFIVTRGASSDRSVMITYAADSHTRYGAIAFYPAADHQPGDLCEVYHYENGKLLGTIPEVSHTFSVCWCRFELTLFCIGFTICDQHPNPKDWKEHKS